LRQIIAFILVRTDLNKSSNSDYYKRVITIFMIFLTVLAVVMQVTLSLNIVRILLQCRYVYQLLGDRMFLN